MGHLFEQAFTPDALYQAWTDASAGKRAKRATLDFGRNLASNLDDLHSELHSGSYAIQPYKQFLVYEPKERVIFAPAFRDLVVQHAIYKLIYPIFNRTFIDQSYACRKGKGTHAAADYAQAALRSSPPDSYLLQLDIKKFFYSIDRSVLRSQIERQIKDQRFVAVMMQFADYGQPAGIPIGNLLSQTYALIYMNPLDHYIKRELGARRYCRYVDDFVIFGWPRERCVDALAKIEVFIADVLHLGCLATACTNANAALTLSATAPGAAPDLCANTACTPLPKPPRAAMRKPLRRALGMRCAPAATGT